MASGVRAGKAYVEIYGDKSPLMRTLRGAQADLDKFGSGVVRLGTQVAAAGAAVLAPFGLAIKAASDLQETLSKFETVFGDRSKEAKVWGDEFAGQVGRSQRQIAQFLAGAQDLFVPLGFEPGAAEAMSKQITKLAVDLASFNNTTDADAMRDLQAALTGSGEVMKKYGVIVSEAAVKQELLNKGIDPTKASDQQKVLARLNIIMAGTTAAQGDATRTAGSFANVQKAVYAELENVAGAIGGAVLPIVTKYAQQVVSAVKEIGKWVEAHQEVIATIAKVAAGVTAIGVGLAALGAPFVGLSGVVKTVTMTLGAMNVALTVIAAHPAIAIIAGLAVAGVALNYALNQASAATWKLTDATKAVTAEADKMRASDQASMNKLQALASQQKLTSAEMATARAVIKSLEDRYGPLGVSIDTTTGKILGMADAQGRLNAAMREQVKANIRDEIDEHVRNIERLQKAAQEVEASGGLFGTTAGFRAEQHLKISQDIDKETAALDALARRRKALYAGEKGALTGAGESASSATAIPALSGSGISKSQQYDQDLMRKFFALKAELSRNQYAIEMQRIRDKWDQERKEAKKANASATTMQAIDSAQKQEEEAARKRHIEEAKKTEEQATRDANGLQIDIDRKRLEERIANLKASGSQDAGTAREIAALQDELDKKSLDQQLADIEAQRKAAIDAAKEKGLFDNTTNEAYAKSAINDKYAKMAELARASFSSDKANRAASIGSRGAPQALVRGTQEEYNARLGMKTPMDQMVELARKQAARDEKRNELLASQRPKVVVSAPP